MAEASNSCKDTSLTMCDVLQEEQELEEDANAVLGGSDDTNCSYDDGYVPRQALYACKTCSINGEAGVCLACCYACHDGHEVVELYTKRNFRCDCGNSKFTNKTCILRSSKEPLNTKNKYNHNFKGLYCSCSRPYPDLEDDVPDEMIQCVFCEDWYHGRHLGVSVPDEYFEMICEKCMQSHPFLYQYLSKYNVDVESLHKKRKSLPEDTKTIVTESESSVKQELVNDTVKSESTNCNGTEITPEDSASIKTESTHCGNNSVKDECLLKSLKVDGVAKGSAFWPENWRKELCRCTDCMTVYINSECEFLLNPDDTIQAYEERGKGRSAESQYDKGLSALGQLDRVKQMEAVRAYTNMKGQLKEYLKEFADNKRTVCESDIKEFFERIGKKQKLNNGVPHFCR